MNPVLVTFLALTCVSLCAADSCAGRCDQNLNNAYTCQCNTHCERFGDCCIDYYSLCVDGTGTSNSFSDLIQDIWNSDTNRFTASDISINPSGSRLFTNVNEAKFLGPTYLAFINLLDNYNRNIGTSESVTTGELQEIEHFLDVVMATEPVTLARVYLSSEGKVGNTQQEFREVLRELWFNLYPRASSNNIADSSGFEHAMVGERKGSTVSGFHSWIQFYLEEKTGSLTYDRMVSTAEPDMKGAAFTWHGGYKSKGSFFLGTSPEFDLSIYTVCALTHPNAICNFQLQGHSVSIQTWDIAHKAGYQIASAYPAI